MGPLSNATYALRYLYPLHARLRESIRGLGQCSWCGALTGELCHTPSGERRFPHAARRALAEHGGRDALYHCPSCGTEVRDADTGNERRCATCGDGR